MSDAVFFAVCFVAVVGTAITVAIIWEDQKRWRHHG